METAQILILGAGKSAHMLIHDLATHHNYKLAVVDQSFSATIKNLAEQLPNIALHPADINHTETRNAFVKNSDVVISMLPAHLHILVAKSCILFGKTLLTASYISEDIKKMEGELTAKGLLFLGEMGLDPGIDHMSAMQIIDRLHNDGAEIQQFYSHCGGLVAPESDDNPWHYKFSWNPKNVINAGKEGALFWMNNRKEQLPYSELFNGMRTLPIPNHGTYAWYPNRDSVSYKKLYGLRDATSFVRTTLRHPQFCHLWNKAIRWKLTDDQLEIEVKEGDTVEGFFRNHFLYHQLDYQAFIQDDDVDSFNFVGMNSKQPLQPAMYTTADVFQLCLEQHLNLTPKDKDLVIMLHQFVYLLNGQQLTLNSLLTLKGENSSNTAMAATVGLPLAAAADLILQKKLTLVGLHRPIIPAIYNPILMALSQKNITFNHYGSGAVGL